VRSRRISTAEGSEPPVEVARLGTLHRRGAENTEAAQRLSSSLRCTVVTSCFFGKTLCEPLRPLRWKRQSTAEGAEERRDFGCGQ
jgi:hypothetical protein